MEDDVRTREEVREPIAAGRWCSSLRSDRIGCCRTASPDAPARSASQQQWRTATDLPVASSFDSLRATSAATAHEGVPSADTVRTVAACLRRKRPELCPVDRRRLNA